MAAKNPDQGISIFTVMSALARDHGAINLSQGFPDFGCDPGLVERVSYWMGQGMNQYAPSFGIAPLREGIAALVKEFYAADYHPETEITVTSGATEALFDAIAALVKPGDEVIVIEPAYDSYVPAIRMMGGIPVFVSLRHPDYTFDWDAIREKLSPRTKAILLNSPHNPSGAALTVNDIAALMKLCEIHPFYIISDEVYEHILFDGRRHESMARYESLRSRSIVISSFGKSFHTTGWKVGYALAPPALTDAFRKVHQFVTFATATPFQYAIADYIRDFNHFRQLPAFYQQKRDLFRNLLKGSAFEMLDCRGTYFQDASYANISSESDLDFARRLTVEHKVAAIPLSPFYHDGTDHKVLRFCFAKKEETLEAAAKVLRTIGQ